MKWFVDTSVLIAASDLGHEHFVPSRTLFLHMTPQITCCAAHTLAEIYGVLTRLPKGSRRTPDEAVLILDQVRSRTSQIALILDEYVRTIEFAATRRLTGGIIYDALLLACARQVEAERIYTWNVRHFRSIAPDLAERIVTP